MKTLHIIVMGRVQGVGFRWFATHAAHAFDITGYVRNLGDSSVEIVASGPASDLRAFQEQIGIGPKGARVDSLLVTERELERFDEFRTLPTMDSTSQ